MELPLKAIVRGYSWTVVPITWRNRRYGVAKLKIKEMGSRYFFICALRLAGEILQPRRLPEAGRQTAGTLSKRRGAGRSEPDPFPKPRFQTLVATFVATLSDCYPRDSPRTPPAGFEVI